MKKVTIKICIEDRSVMEVEVKERPLIPEEIERNQIVVAPYFVVRKTLLEGIFETAKNEN